MQKAASVEVGRFYHDFFMLYSLSVFTLLVYSIAVSMDPSSFLLHVRDFQLYLFESYVSHELPCVTHPAHPSQISVQEWDEAVGSLDYAYIVA